MAEDLEKKHQDNLSRIRSIAERLSSFTSDYLLIAKADDALFYKASNSDWARLHADKYLENARNESLLSELANMLSKGKAGDE